MPSLLRQVAVTAVLGLSLLTAGFIQSPARAQDRQARTMLVIDSSVAMQSALGNETKMEATKNALAVILQRYEGKLDLGIAAFGHRKAKACEDVSVLSPPRPMAAAALAKQIAPLRPTGSSPLALAVREATAALGPDAGPARLILVAGGIDTCNADPCAAAREAKAEQKVRIDVVALRGPGGEDLKALRCIAKLSGGTYFEVANAAKLSAALNKAFRKSVLPKNGAAGTADTDEEAMTADASAGSYAGVDASGVDQDGGGDSEDPAGLVMQSAVTALPEDAPAAQPAADGKISIRFAALLADPGPQIDTGLVWRIYDRKAGDDGLNRLVAKSEDAAPRVALPPGDYMVNVSFGKAYATRSVRIEPGRPSRELFVLNAGGLRLLAKSADGADIPSGAVVSEIYSDEQDQAGNRTLIVSGVKLGVILRLNAGIYHVKSLYGDANGLVQGDISIEAGRLTDMTLTHDAASVTLKLVTQRGGEAVADTQWRIYTQDGALVRESVGALPTHILAPGRYNVEAIRGGQKYADSFEVEPGTPRTVEVVLPQE
ncbi:MAG: hypothetical protein R3D57_08075 [Hyphomicrobiaceae bacterium]